MGEYEVVQTHIGENIQLIGHSADAQFTGCLGTDLDCHLETQMAL